jgi:hypothetical protein
VKSLAGEKVPKVTHQPSSPRLAPTAFPTSPGLRTIVLLFHLTGALNLKFVQAAPWHLSARETSAHLQTGDRIDELRLWH